MKDLVHVASDGDTPVDVGALGLTGVRRYERFTSYAHAAPSGARWLTLGDAAPGDGPGDASLAALGAVRAVRYRHLYPEGGHLTADGVVTDRPVPVGAAVLSVMMDVDLDALDEFHGWYNEEHLPRLITVPGVLAVRRFQRIGGDAATEGRERFVAIYELDGTAAVTGEAWAKAGVMTPRTEAVVQHLAWASQLYGPIVT
jgi:hypothetical protein